MPLTKTLVPVGFIDTATNTFHTLPPQPAGRPTITVQVPDGMPVTALAQLQGVFATYRSEVAPRFGEQPPPIEMTLVVEIVGAQFTMSPP